MDQKTPTSKSNVSVTKTNVDVDAIRPDPDVTKTNVEATTESGSRASENPAPLEAVVEKPAAKTREEAAKKLKIEKKAGG